MGRGGDIKKLNRKKKSVFSVARVHIRHYRVPSQTQADVSKPLAPVSVSSRMVQKNVARNKDQLISPSGVGIGLAE